VEASKGPRSILVVVVNYRTPALTLACLESLAPEIATIPDAHCVVVDNASGDDSVPAIRSLLDSRGFGNWLTLLESDTNRGFAGGNNLGIAHGEPAEYVLLLNSDTVVHPGSLNRCLEVMRENPRVGAMSCRVLNSDGTIQNVTRRLPSPLRMTCAAAGLPWRWPRLFGWADTDDLGWDREHLARNVDWLGGAFLFIRSAALGGRVRLDEDFFFYGEDIEICHRIWKFGWTCHYDPLATITHHGGASSDPSRMPSGKRSSHRFKARYLVQQKCYGRWASEWARALDLGVTSAHLLRAQLRRRGEIPELRERLKLVLNRGEPE
jgi:GT2 family glycosyltransferase